MPPEKKNFDVNHKEVSGLYNSSDSITAFFAAEKPHANKYKAKIPAKFHIILIFPTLCVKVFIVSLYMLRKHIAIKIPIIVNGKSSCSWSGQPLWQFDSFSYHDLSQEALTE